VEQAFAETQAILGDHAQSSGAARVLPRAAEETRGLAPPLLLLFGATALLLLLACGNIATLATAEIQGRRHEIATRSAMGAGPVRIVRLLLSESLLLALLGSLLGVALAHGGVEILVALAPAIPHLAEVAVDLRVLGFASLLTVLTAFLFGGIPALLASRRPAAPLLTGGARASRPRGSLVRVVMGAELALAVLLLVAGGLLGRSLYRLLDTDPGFDARGLAAVEVRLPESRYDREASGAFFREALARVRAIPGIGTVTAVSRLPFPGSTSTMPFEVQGRSFGPLFYQVGPRYFETLDVPILAGRSLDETSRPGDPLTIVVNETAARRFWPQGSPLGARVTLGFTQDPVTVVGVAGDMKRQALAGDAEPAFYIPFSQLPDQTLAFLARTRMDASEAVPLMREAVVSLDRELVVSTATTLSELVEDSARHERFRALLMNAFGLLATLLASAGVIGVTARSVSLRTREMGIRLALGARRPGLVKETVVESLVVGLCGTVVGLLGALWATRLLSGLLFGVQAWDPLTYGAVAVSVLVVCALASYAPARRISRVDPLKVLQAE
jgi:putative ABC transport system permease protein